MTSANTKSRSSSKQSPAPAPSTKIGLVLALIQRKEGAILAELVQATGWQPHTVRAALSGLRKKGHQLQKSKRDEVSCYRVKGA